MTWRNWGRSQRAEPSEVHAPVTATDVQHVVESVRARGGTLRPVGAGHSFSAAARPDDAHVTLDGLAGLVRVDAATREAALLAGTRIAEVPALLRPSGLAMEVVGDIDQQTIAGAVSTGTHGTGLAFGSISSTVTAATLVDGEGRLVRVSATERPDLLPAVRVGLGALGVLVDVTIRCVPSFALDAVEAVVDLDPVLDDWRGIVERTDHFELYWFPTTRVAVTKSNRRTQGPLRPRSRVGRFLDERVLTDVGHRALLALGALAPATRPGVNALSAQLMPRGRFVEPSHEVFSAPRSVRFREMEYGIPLDAVPSAMREIDRALRRADLAVTFPVEVRASAADDAHLSTAHGRESGYVAVHRWWREDPRPLFDVVEPILLAHEGRPHWGKLHSLDAPRLAERFPGFGAFLAARDELDPHRTFASAWTRRVLGA